MMRGTADSGFGRVTLSPKDPNPPLDPPPPRPNNPDNDDNDGDDTPGGGGGLYRNHRYKPDQRFGEIPIYGGSGTLRGGGQRDVGAHAAAAVAASASSSSSS